VRIYLSATEDLYKPSGAAVRMRHLLVSYAVTRNAQSRFNTALAQAGDPHSYVIDSGAHLYISQYFKHGRIDERAVPEKHMREFMTVCRTLERRPAFVVEMDLQDLYGLPVVEQWREELCIPFEHETGIPVCYVWHGNDGRRGWDALLRDDRKRVLGIGGKIISKGGLSGGDAQAMVLDAYAAGKAVHGFAQVKTDVMRTVPFSSVDSTSWGSAAIYGSTSVFDAASGTVRKRYAGRRDFALHPDKAMGVLLTTGGRVRRDDMQNAAGTVKVYQEAVNAYDQQEQFFTAWWLAKGVDWSKHGW